MQNAVREFHVAMNHPAPEAFDPGGFRAELRARLILEEATEIAQALGFDVGVEAYLGEEPSVYLTHTGADVDWPAVVDGLCDLTYVTLGAAVEAGVEFSPFFAEVHRSNMTKVGGEHREDGKQLKPATYEPPRLGEMWRRVVERGRRWKAEHV